MFRSSAILAATLVAALFALGPPAQAGAAECTTDYCVETTETGVYVLIVPALGTDCVWKVDIDFGDGTSDEYVFDGEKGLAGSHTFPQPGVYTVTIEVGEGTSAGGEECPERTITATVTYPEPPDETPKEEPPPGVPTGGAGNAPAPVPAAADAAPPNALSTPGPQAGSKPVPYWRHCRASILTHLIACGKGRKVARAAQAKLAAPGSARVSGFSCRLPQGDVQPIACARGEQRVLAPAG